MADNYIDWTGLSGNTYRYWFMSEMKKPSIEAAAGNYMFVKEQADGWVPIYIGETGNLGERLTNHPELPCVKRNGGTHLMAHTTPGGKDKRTDEEADLIDYWSPPCNG